MSGAAAVLSVVALDARAVRRAPVVALLPEWHEQRAGEFVVAREGIGGNSDHDLCRVPRFKLVRSPAGSRTPI